MKWDSQSICLESWAGVDFIDDYDAFPEPVRKRLAASPFNICAACVGLRGGDYFATIEAMEQEIREREATQNE